ncbi:hypothetical protein [Microbacterium ureisolvens]|uniref:Uncharacterized protein n=1 Tax=Microbacterium ureisolvens TaxID=2781186 RepID=A0ABS7HZT0_9MICO|nr:hypothetical protein [Microbacterium ureisolvens]MBW9110025.1 hypothetical protein [Microbacterium ureisolvens]
MKSSTMRLYWKVIGYGSITGVVIAVAIMAVYYDTFAIWSTGDRLAVLRWGSILGLISAIFVAIGTVATARKLDTTGGRISFALLSFLAPIIGWALVGIGTGLTATWHFFWGYPLIGFVAGVVSGLISVLATFFMPHTSAGAGAVNAPDDTSDLFKI